MANFVKFVVVKFMLKFHVKFDGELINPPVSEQPFTQHHCGMLIGSLDSLTRGIFRAACF